MSRIAMLCPHCRGAKCWRCYRLGWVLIPMLTIIRRGK